VLDFRTYSAPNQAEEHPTTKENLLLWNKFDRNNISADERIAICYTRGIALSLFEWIRKWCIIKTPNGEIIDDLPSKYVVGLLDTLLLYKSKADLRKLKGAPHCAAWMLKAQVSNVVKCDKSVGNLWKAKKGKTSDSLRMNLVEGCTVEWSEHIPLAIIKSSKLFLLLFYCQTDIPSETV